MLTRTRLFHETTGHLNGGELEIKSRILRIYLNTIKINNILNSTYLFISE